MRFARQRLGPPRGGAPLGSLFATLAPQTKASFWTLDPGWTPPANAAKVASWRDAGAENKPAEWAVDANQPTYYSSVAALNGLPGITFAAASSQLLRTAAWGSVLAQPSFVVSAGTLTSTGVMHDGRSVSARHLLQRTAGNAYQFGAGSYPFGGTVDTDPHICVAVYNGASGGLFVDDFDTPLVTGNVNTQSLDGLVLGASYGLNGYANVDLHLVMAGPFALLADPDMVTFLGLLRDSLGITA